MCDGSALGGESCTTSGSYTGGTLNCQGDCGGYDYSQCTGGPAPTCGDGIINVHGEDCDGTALGGESCTTLGYDSGSLACTTGCKLDTSGCSVSAVNFCGDGSANREKEDCDGSDLKGASCSDASNGYYSGGELNCYGGCTYDYSQCTGATAVCGNGIIDDLENEECDIGEGSYAGISDFGNKNCNDYGYQSGNLGCTTGCKLDLNECSQPVLNPSQGICETEESSTEGTCQDGGEFIIYTWRGKWIWSQDCSDLSCQSENSELKTQCETEQTRQLLCPAQIALPFFTTLNFLITIAIISLIYTIVILKKKVRVKHKRK